MISKDTLASLKSNIDSITEYQDVDLVKRGDWGAITFESVKEHITYAIDTTSVLAQMPLESLTDQAANDLQSQMPAVASLFARINEFGIEQGNASATRDQIANEVKGNVEQMHAMYSRWLPYLAYQRGDITRNIEKMEDAIRQGDIHLDQAKRYLEEKMEEVNKIVDAAREAAASAGVVRLVMKPRN